MTNLSDLLPAGGGAKEATAIAFGTYVYWANCSSQIRRTKLR